MAISLTPAAAAHIERNLAERGSGIGLRLGVKTTGCSGLAYQLDFADERKPEDLVFESHGVKVVVDPKSLAYIDGRSVCRDLGLLVRTTLRLLAPALFARLHPAAGTRS